MAYNYDKSWLDKQEATIKLLVELADKDGMITYTFDNANARSNYSSYINNIKASLAHHYPLYSKVHQVIRTWKEIDAQGTYLLHVGTLNNYKGSTRIVKTRTGVQAVDMKLRGATPTGAGYTNSRSVLGLSQPLTQQEEVELEPFELLDTQSDMLMGLVPKIRELSDGMSAQVIHFKNCNIDPDTAKQFMDSMPEWTVEEFNQADGNNYTDITLRRKGQLE